MSTRKLIYFSLFHSVLSYSMINWGKSNVTNLHGLQVLQNEFIRASLFLPRDCPINILFKNMQTLTLDDMIKMKHANLCLSLKIICYLLRLIIISLN